MKYIAFFVLAWFAFATTSHAAQTSNFDQVVILTENKSAQARSLALQQATQEMLVRLSGHQKVLENPMIIEALQSPSNPYVSQYDYKPNPDEANKEQPWMMVASFDTRALSNLLRKAQASLWPKNRPSVLVWFVVEEGFKRRIVGAEDQSFFLESLKESGDKRGLPVFLPLMDYEDEQAITPTQLWAMYDDNIFMASDRYGAETVLVGRAYELSPGQWQGQWRLFFKGKVYPLNIEGAEPATFMAAGVNHSAELLADFYAIDLSSTQSDKVVMQVHGIKTIEQYADVTSYLSRLNGIKEYDLTEVKKESLLLSIQTEGSVAQLEELIRLDNRLIPVKQPGFMQSVDEGAQADAIEAGSIEAKQDNTLHYVLISLD